MNKNENLTYTRKISPKLGILGILGLLGFTGLLPVIFQIQSNFQVPFMYFFFAFFGFFGFYYEGKMSNTLIDERYQYNRFRAFAIANRISLTVILGTAILSISLLRINNTYVMLSILISIIGFSFGLSTFLSQYLLYRFENEE